MKKKSVMFIAGDPSGDLHASHIVGELKRRDPGIEVWGVGGPAMAEAGLEQVMPFEPFNRMGFAEVLKNIGFFLDAKRELINIMKTARRPDVLVCVDYSGFNMPMMKAARKLGVPVVWYIAPMVWVWKRKRAKTLGENASHIAVIFPFETQYFAPYPAPVAFVGNPLVESQTPKPKPQISDSKFTLSLIPGSREQEIRNMLPLMIKAADMLRDKHPNIKITVSRFRGMFDDDYFEPARTRGFEIFTGELSELLQKTDLALITSGTATLETALAGVPMVITYKTSPISYAIYRCFIEKRLIGLPNIVAQKRIVPECVQKSAVPKNLFEELDKFAADADYREETIKDLLSLRARLGEKKPSAEVADIVYSYLK